MFIVKDLRKIPEILSDPNDERTELKLARRGPELKGNLDVLVNTATDESLSKVNYLSLYNDGLNTLKGISIFSQSNLITVNLGKNFLREIPSEFSLLQSIEELHLEDNKFTEFPSVLLELINLKTLRLSGNAINTVPNLSCLSKLQKLYIDNCHLSSIDNILNDNYELVELQIRGNTISNIPDEIYNLTKLEVLYMNSNVITEISSNIEQLTQLRVFVANSNRINVIPSTILNLKNITRINLCNNNIDELPSRVVQEWISSKPNYTIQLEGNPLVVNPRALSESEFTQPVTKEWKKQKTK